MVILRSKFNKYPRKHQLGGEIKNLGDYLTLSFTGFIFHTIPQGHQRLPWGVKKQFWPRRRQFLAPGQ
jgi:hypothetical protein